MSGQHESIMNTSDNLPFALDLVLDTVIRSNMHDSLDYIAWNKFTRYS